MSSITCVAPPSKPKQPVAIIAPNCFVALTSSRTFACVATSIAINVGHVSTPTLNAPARNVSLATKTATLASSIVPTFGLMLPTLSGLTCLESTPLAMAELELLELAPCTQLFPRPPLIHSQLLARCAVHPPPKARRVSLSSTPLAALRLMTTVGTATMMKPSLTLLSVNRRKVKMMKPLSCIPSVA